MMNSLSHNHVSKKVFRLLSTLKKTKISKRFARIVYKLSKLIVSEIEPIQYILKGNTLNKTYAEIINLRTKIKIKSIKINNNNRNNIIIIPVHVDNKVTGNSHLILFIYNTRNKFLFSLDPSDSKKTKITELKLFQALKTSRRFIYRGIHKYTRILHHHGLCRFATPLLFKYNVKLNNRILKKEVIKYFEYLLN
jgi:hypothetical protein